MDIREPSVYKGSEELFEYSCGPCSTISEHKEANGFCKTCKDYLCETCFKSHSISKPSRHHTLLDKHNMPKMSVKLCEACKTVGDENEAVGFCKNCDDYLCKSCFKSHSISKASKHHVLIDKENMQKGAEKVQASFADDKMKVPEGGTDSQKHTEEYTHIRGINVKTKEDKKECFILAMTMVTSSEILLADFNNESLKLVDLETDVIKERLKLKTVPLGLSMISQDQAAVILHYYKNKIQIISIRGGLSVLQTLDTDGECVDVKCVSGKLYVSFCNPVKFQILQSTGAVIKTINPDSEVRNHCTLPDYIAVSPDESMIYISDWKTNKVMCIDMNGVMISRYQGALHMPCDIAISPFESVYLCNRKQGHVYKMTSNLSEATAKLGSADGLIYPAAMSFNASKQHLYISSGCDNAKFCNFVKVYMWK